ncbi:hypothetical protein JUJ52_03460 [Virgibacillus sp. AGTR]|uniref:hypothetical protein n=1 Tax=Virgibacillus sp. AGTR TaxID=2812055 RepID=UPI001D161F8C|nr:hypothetical protein [Virgibacillus sp. AGTR]MCC2249015.1 hypothetical protein [Virgibacillus sp. AGTR]
MPKKKILYPLIKETTYYPSDNEYYKSQGLAGKPDKVKNSLMMYDGYVDQNVNYVENRVFNETLTYTGYGRGRSSAVFYFKDSTGATYQMFMTDMDALLSSKDLIDGKVTGTWKYCKRGKNFGIKLAY